MLAALDSVAAETGEITSSHLGGLTVDLNKRGLPRKQRQWISEYVYQLQQAGLASALQVAPSDDRYLEVWGMLG